MNKALDAVRYADSAAFTDSPKMASKTAKRALLRHLADMSRWSCELSAYLNNRQPPKCDHRACDWLCFQSELETADEMSMSESAIKRTRRALVSDGWIKLTQDTLGRGAITFYTINKDKLYAVTKPKHQKRCKLPDSLVPPTPPVPADDKEGSMPLFIPAESTPATTGDKGSEVPPFPAPPKTEGVQPAPPRGAACTHKGGNVPLPNKKNRNEPSTEPKAIPMPSAGPTDAQLERVYWAYPKHVEKPDALKAIRAAVKELASGRERPPCSVPEALEFLFQRVTAYAASAEGQAGKFTPKPSTWFNKQRYHDDEKEWNHAADQGHRQANRGQARENSIIDTYRRAEAIANSPAARVPADGTEGSHGGAGISLVRQRP